jgi:hypothetical protein
MDNAQAFFDLCESGKGADGCAEYIAEGGGTFSCQAMDALPGPPITACKTVAEYADWMKGVCENMGDKATYVIDLGAEASLTRTAPVSLLGG